MIKAVLFDLDGTLVDHDGAAEIAITKVLAADHAYARRRWKELEALAMERYLAGELTFTEQRRLRATTLAGRGPRLGVITNGDGEQQRKKLERVGLAEDLPYVVVSSEVGAAKPDPRIFHHACDGLGLKKEEVAYVGDRRETDAMAATDAGLRGIWLDRPRTSLKDIPAML